MACTIAFAQPGVPRRAVPRFRRADGGLAEQVEIVLAALGGGAIGLAALLRFEDERAALVAVDPAEADGAVAVVLEHAALEHIVVLGIVGAAAVRRLDPDQPAQAVDEALRVRELRSARVAPLRDELFDVESLPHASTLGGRQQIEQHRRGNSGARSRADDCSVNERPISEAR